MNQKVKKSNTIQPAMVKVGTSRQVAIPKRIYDQLSLATGDYLEVNVKNGNLILSPKDYIDKRLAKALQDVKEGRGIGPFSTVEEAMKALLK
jgi:AbrB family looped-hinge helix DNA binding protein